MTPAAPPGLETLNPTRRCIMRVFSRLHVWLYRLSRGRLGQQTPDGDPVLLLTTRGRRTGRLRTTPLVYFRDGDRLVVCGGSGGTPGHPAWFLNLRANSTVGLQIGGHRFNARTREVEGPERAHLWRAMAERVPRMEAYQRSVARTVPLVVLTPTAEDASSEV